MIHNKFRYLLTLVALIAVTTGAWADETPLVTIEIKDYKSFKSGSMTFDDKVTVTFSNEVYNGGNAYGWYAGYTASLLTVAGTNGYTITSCKFYTNSGVAATGYTVEGKSPSVYLFDGVVYTDDSKSVNIGESGVTKIEVYGAAASSGPTVDWNKAAKTGTFTMPGGNVTLEPEYYPQAALTEAPTAINDVPATTDGAIVKAGTVANIGSTTTAQGTVMYYVSPTALDDAALLALAADAWTADVPTAAHLAQGQAYVYYYVRGNDSDTDEENFNDGDILAANALTVTIAAEPTYDVTYAEGTQDADKWTVKAGTDGSFQSLPLKGVKAGTKVKLKYDGDRSMLKGVKAVKKGAAPAPDPVALSAVTADYIGSVVTSDGNVYPAKTAVPAGKTAVGILGKVTETGHGLILALNDAPSQEWNTIDNWTSASYAGTTLKVLTDAARGTNLTSYTTLGETTVSNWAVAQKIDYEAIFTNLGSTTGDSDGTTYDANVNAYITTDVGGTAISGEYWSATMKNGDLAWYFSGSYWNYQGFKSDSRSVRPVLGF